MCNPTGLGVCLTTNVFVAEFHDKTSKWVCLPLVTSSRYYLHLNRTCVITSNGSFVVLCRFGRCVFCSTDLWSSYLCTLLCWACEFVDAKAVSGCVCERFSMYACDWMCVWVVGGCIWVVGGVCKCMWVYVCVSNWRVYMSVCECVCGRLVVDVSVYEWLEHVRTWLSGGCDWVW